MMMMKMMMMMVANDHLEALISPQLIAACSTVPWRGNEAIVMRRRGGRGRGLFVCCLLVA